MSNDGYLSTYGELADLLDSLPDLIREARRTQRITLTVVADETGLSLSTISRLAAGGDVSLGNATLLLRWLDRQGRNTERESDL